MRLPIILAIIGILGSVASQGLPLAYPDLQPWVWKTILWSSVTLIICAVGLAVSLLRAETPNIEIHKVKSRNQTGGVTAHTVSKGDVDEQKET